MEACARTPCHIVLSARWQTDGNVPLETRDEIRAARLRSRPGLAGAGAGLLCVGGLHARPTITTSPTATSTASSRSGSSTGGGGCPPRRSRPTRSSRMADSADPNHEPIPPDEPAARDFQISNRFPFEYHGWKKRGHGPDRGPRLAEEHPRRVRRQGPPGPGLDHAAGDREQPRLPVQVREPLPGGAQPDAGPVPVHGPGVQQLGMCWPDPGLRARRRTTSSS